MEWQEQGAVLAARPHGENAAIVELFTPERGRHLGVVRGGSGRKLAPVLQPGAQVQAKWRARLEEHLGAFTVEPVRSRAGEVMSDRSALAGLNAICALLSFALPERQAFPELYERTQTLLDLLPHPDAWPLAYVRWELALLDDLGFGLDLTHCAVTGRADGLALVSPRTGSAVTVEGAGEWADKLLPLPNALTGRGDVDQQQILDGLRTTGHFLETKLAAAMGDRPLPSARARLLDRLAR